MGKSHSKSPGRDKSPLLHYYVKMPPLFWSPPGRILSRIPGAGMVFSTEEGTDGPDPFFRSLDKLGFQGLSFPRSKCVKVTKIDVVFVGIRVVRVETVLYAYAAYPNFRVLIPFVKNWTYPLLSAPCVVDLGLART